MAILPYSAPKTPRVLAAAEDTSGSQHAALLRRHEIVRSSQNMAPEHLARSAVVHAFRAKGLFTEAATAACVGRVRSRERAATLRTFSRSRRCRRASRITATGFLQGVYGNTAIQCLQNRPRPPGRGNLPCT